MSVRAYPRDIREAKICFAGARRWFPERGIAWAEVVESGVAVEWLEATGDELALRVAKIARARAEREGA